ncbi:hypothetical protein GW17_00031166 [Ensete ventricosum]|nr:hypothetical protein GW17_00031166 [Ensete ventricosum]
MLGTKTGGEGKETTHVVGVSVCSLRLQRILLFRFVRHTDQSSVANHRRWKPDVYDNVRVYGRSNLFVELDAVVAESTWFGYVCVCPCA